LSFHIVAAHMQQLKEAKKKEKEMETKSKRFMNHQADIQQHQQLSPIYNFLYKLL